MPTTAAENTARATADNITLKEVDLVPSGRLLFAVGTPLAPDGQGNYAAKRTDWASKPLNEDGAAQFRALVNAQDRRDFVRDLSAVRMDEGGKLVGANGKALPVTREALAQALDRARRAAPGATSTSARSRCAAPTPTTGSSGRTRRRVASRRPSARHSASRATREAGRSSRR